jgi:DNA-directed RNA polymerase subunit beta'
VVDIWAQATEKITEQLVAGIAEDTVLDAAGNEQTVPSFNAIFMMADSGARGSTQQMRQLAGMRGLMAKPSGAIIETPITSNFREGLSVLQYFISTHGARKGLADTALKTANSGYLTRRLVDVSQDVIVRGEDCGAEDALEVSPLVEGGDIVEPLGERILGRVAATDVLDPVNSEVLVASGEELDEDRVRAIENAGVETVMVRSVLTCAEPFGICVKCYGRDLSRGTMVNLGEAVGVIAAQSIGEPGTQLTMRTFHIGGAATRRAEQSHAESGTEGEVRFHNIRNVRDAEGLDTVMTRHGEVGIVDASGRERERHPVVYGATLRVKEGDQVQSGTILLDWDPFASPIIAEIQGLVEFVDIVEGSTMQEQVDEFTGVSSKVIIESKDPSLRPSIVVKGPDGDSESRSLLPVNAFLSVAEGEEVGAGRVVAKIPREASKTKDITGGLPRVAELFEARKPKECAVVAEIDGTVSFGQDVRGKRRVLVTPLEGGEPDEYLIPKGKHVSVHENDRVKAGEALMDGSSNPHDILKIKGEKALASYLVDEVQEVYRLQGVKINDKHIEVIVRQMLRKVRITDAGETDFLLGEHVERRRFSQVNAELEADGRQPASAEPQLLGITKASLSTESFISAASFQETTKVLTEAAIWGKTDRLRGLKENVIMGRLIPAGTGLDKYQGLGIQVEAPEGQLTVDTDEISGQALEDGGLSETAVEEPTVQLDPGILEG